MSLSDIIPEYLASCFMCFQHFKNNAPTGDFPDPLPTLEGESTPNPRRCRPPQKKRLFLNQSISSDRETDTEDTDIGIKVHAEGGMLSSVASVQTDGKWIEPMEILHLAIENKDLQQQTKEYQQQIQTMSLAYNDFHNKVHKNNKDEQTQVNIGSDFQVENVKQDDKEFKYYTGFTPDQFRAIYKFMVPSESEIPIKLPSNRVNEVMKLTWENQLFLTIVKLRQDFDYNDLGYRFHISKQTVSVIFTCWIKYMFLRLGELSIWPSREIITVNMPPKYKQEFPTTFGILDCTEIKINKPSSLKAQSQTYSEYKAGNTLKGLVACDPRGSVKFASMLFSGGISDKDIFTRSGFQQMLLDLIEEGYLKKGDGLMADKGFNIVEEVAKCGLVLNIPPFAQHGQQMS
ncbi:hypothetical protein ScPMuIL_002588 [Solemya velum]